MSALEPQTAREALVRVFSRHRRKLRAGTVGADEDLEFKKRLQSTKADDLSPVELLSVLFGYCADAASFKHYLPRFLEVAVSDRRSGGPSVADLDIFFESHRFAEWPEDERAAVEQFFAAHGIAASPSGRSALASQT